MEREMVVVLDFGGQYNQLIARRVRECNVYCEVHPYNLSLDKLKEMHHKMSSRNCIESFLCNIIQIDKLEKVIPRKRKLKRSLRK